MNPGKRLPAAGALRVYAAALCCWALPAAPAQVVAANDLTSLSLEELSNISITSVSGNAEPLSGAAASIYVITGDDIRRSAATSLPEALRLAPNLQVARVDARNYAITARGSNGVFENKMLVLIDGRTVYSPLFSGVFWDAQDVMLEDVDRIEVISGPGGTLWGSNAVNGVINVITKSARDTEGGMLTAGTGTHENGAGVRYGAKMDNGGSFRIYGKSADYDNTSTAAGTNALDGWHRGQIGFRTDWGLAGGTATVQGDAYQGDLHQAGTQAILIGGSNLTGHWDKHLDDGSQLRVLAYFDHTDRHQPGAYVDDLNTGDVEVQHSFRFGSANHITWGGGYRFSADRIQNAAAFAFLPGAENLRWGNVFAQDEIALRSNLNLTIGGKFESNTYTGIEFLPSVRLAWKVAPSHLLWAAVSRAVRAPSRIDTDLYSPPAPILIGGVPKYVIAGGPNFQAEIAKVYEIGYRGQPAAVFSYSATAFYQDYTRLGVLVQGPGGLNDTFQNKMTGSVGGVETWGNWQVMRAWRLSAGFVSQHTRLRTDPGVTIIPTALQGDDPSHYWSLRSSMDLGRNHELDIYVRRVGALPAPVVPAYYAVDMRVGWRLQKNVQIALIVQNMFDPHHVEFGTAPNYSEIGRSIFAKLTLNFP